MSDTQIAVSTNGEGVVQRALTAASVRFRKLLRNPPSSWHSEAWDLYDSVGELRAAVNAKAQAASRATIHAARRIPGEDDPRPIMVDEGDPPHPATEIVEQIGHNELGRAELIRRYSIHFDVVGESWLAILPDDSAPAGERWTALAAEEVKVTPDRITVSLGLGSDGQANTINLNPAEAFLSRVWRAHPRRYWETDSPVRANLAVLRELVALTKHVSAQIDSRLVNAGLLFLPNSIEFPSLGEDVENSADSYTEMLMEIAAIAIANPESAAARVPIISLVPDEVIGKIDLMKFWSDLDEQAKVLRDEAIRRLALGLDMPPELILGLGGATTWNAWQISEGFIEVQINPMLNSLAEALTVDYLWPALDEVDLPEGEKPEDFVVWFDTSVLTARPNRATEAQAGHDRGVISDDTLRRALGFDQTDAPDASNQALILSLDLVRANPSLAQVPGLVALAQQIDELLKAREDGTDISDLDATVGLGRGSRPGGPEGDSEPTEPDRAEPNTRQGDAPDTGGEVPSSE